MQKQIAKKNQNENFGTNSQKIHFAQYLSNELKRAVHQIPEHIFISDLLHP